MWILIYSYDINWLIASTPYPGCLGSADGLCDFCARMHVRVHRVVDGFAGSLVGQSQLASLTLISLITGGYLTSIKPYTNNDHPDIGFLELISYLRLRISESKIVKRFMLSQTHQKVMAWNGWFSIPDIFFTAYFPPLCDSRFLIPFCKSSK